MSNNLSHVMLAVACCLIPLGIVALAFGVAFTRAHAMVASASKGATR